MLRVGYVSRAFNYNDAGRPAPSGLSWRLRSHVSPEPSLSPGPRTRRFVAWTLRHGKLLWALAIVLALPAAWRFVKLYRKLRSDIE